MLVFAQKMQLKCKLVFCAQNNICAHKMQIYCNKIINCGHKILVYGQMLPWFFI